MKTKQNKGFTLIELLVVIAIIGILAGIVLVSLGGVRDRATVASLRSTMASATTIANLCAAEEGADAVNAYGADSPICDAVDIVGNWPTVADNVGSIFYAGGGSDTITGTAAVTPAVTVTCTISTGSCI